MIRGAKSECRSRLLICSYEPVCKCPPALDELMTICSSGDMAMVWIVLGKTHSTSASPYGHKVIAGVGAASGTR